MAKKGKKQEEVMQQEEGAMPLEDIVQAMIPPMEQSQVEQLPVEQPSITTPQYSLELTIGVPCMQQLDFNFVNSILNLHKPDGTCFVFESNSLVHDARNNIATTCINTNSEYTLWLDSDMKIPANAYEVLKSRQADIITGLYFKRVPPYSPLIYQGLQLNDDMTQIINLGEQLNNYPRQSLFEIDGCGFGCMLIKTEVMKRVKEVFGTMFDPTVLGIGEDLIFLQRAKRLGYRVWCDSSVLCGHVGSLVVGEDMYRQYNHITD